MYITKALYRIWTYTQISSKVQNKAIWNMASPKYTLQDESTHKI